MNAFIIKYVGCKVAWAALKLRVYTWPWTNWFKELCLTGATISSRLDYCNSILGGIYMRPGRTQTGLSWYRPPYISIYAFTWDRSDNELRLVWLRLGRWTETRNSRTGLSSYRSHVNDNKSQTGFRNLKPVCFWVSDIFIWQNTSFCPETRHQAFRPGFM